MELKIEPGMTVYLMRLINKHRGTYVTGTLTKIGRKFYIVDYCNREIKFYKDSFLEQSIYSPDYKLYFSEQDIEDTLEHNELTQYMTTYNSYNRLTLHQLRLIKAILEAKEEIISEPTKER